MGAIGVGSGNCGSVNPSDIYLTNDTATIVAARFGQRTHDRGGQHGQEPGGAVSSNGLIAHACNGGVNSTNIVVDGGLQHDVVQTASGQHLQCIPLTGAYLITVENVVFENRAQYDLNIGSPTNTTTFSCRTM